jgi:hypothetical protein
MHIVPVTFPGLIHRCTNSTVSIGMIMEGIACIVLGRIGTALLKYPHGHLVYVASLSFPLAILCRAVKHLTQYQLALDVTTWLMCSISNNNRRRACQSIVSYWPLSYHLLCSPSFCREPVKLPSMNRIPSYHLHHSNPFAAIVTTRTRSQSITQYGE